MGFHIRKSISVGPFRFNLSNSGLGMSAGVRGLRVGTGPRGNYVRMGRGGIYYQHTFTDPARAARIPVRTPQPAVYVPDSTHAPLQSIESASAAQIADSSSEQLLDEIRQKRRLFAFTPLVIAAAIVFFSSLWPADRDGSCCSRRSSGRRRSSPRNIATRCARRW
jgi:hypothetical protein